MPDAPRVYLDAHRVEILDELISFAAIPSVSADSAYRGDVERAARWVADRLTRAGLEHVRLFPTQGNPVVFGEWTRAAGAPTVIVYGHYDVQPPDPLDRWITEPFHPVIRKGRLYGRGVSDDKGPLIIPIKVVEAFHFTTGLPVNVKFLVEGEEERAGSSLDGFIETHRSLLSADFVLAADGAMWRHDEPSLTVASRGVAEMEFSLTGATKDLHSGRHGGCVANALNAMARLVASLHDDTGRVAVEGFYDDVAELTPEEREAIASLPFDEARYLRETGAPATWGERGYSVLERQWTRPALDVNGLWGGYQGEGSKTVIPAEAHAKLSCRLVPNQIPATTLDRIARHLRTHVPPGTTLTVHDTLRGTQPYRIPADHPGLRLAADVLEDIYGRPPVTVRMGASVPVCQAFRQHLGIDTVFFSFSTADEDYHAPNEFFRVNRLYEGLEAWTRYFERLATTRARSRNR